MRILFDETAIIKRNREYATNKYRLSATATADANIQQLDRETVQKLQGAYGEEYVMYVDAETTIAEGDFVVRKSTDERFRVKEVIKAQMMGIEHFLEVYMTKVSE